MTIDEKNLAELVAQEVPPEEAVAVTELLQNVAKGEVPTSDGVPAEILAENLPENLGAEGEALPADEATVERRSTDIRNLINEMNMAQKLKAAMLGNALVRRILVLDPSRLVQECVLNNPKLGMNEVEDFARNPNMNVQALRSISSRSTWMRTYKVKLNLVCNPKCPADLSLRWLRFLHDNDVKILSRSKNIPQVLQVAAKKKLSDK